VARFPTVSIFWNIQCVLQQRESLRPKWKCWNFVLSCFRNIWLSRSSVMWSGIITLYPTSVSCESLIIDGDRDDLCVRVPTGLPASSACHSHNGGPLSCFPRTYCYNRPGVHRRSFSINRCVAKPVPDFALKVERCHSNGVGLHIYPLNALLTILRTLMGIMFI
jgi:hypothetical protein